MQPAFGYLRVSGRGQLDGDGFDRQRETITRYCDSKGLFILRWFEDGAVSGEVDTADRDGFVEMITLAGDATTKLIIVERADRLARTLIVSELACDNARKSGLSIVDASTGTDLTNSDDPGRILIRQIFGATAEWSKNVTIKRLASARQRIRLTKGKCEGRKSFGFFTGQAETVSLIVQWREKMGWTMKRIARELRERHIPTPEGSAYWHTSSVCRIYNRTVAERRRETQKPDGKLLLGLPV